MVLPPLKYTCTPYFWAGSFEAFTQPFVIWHHYVVLFLVASHAVLVFLFVSLGWCPHFYFYPVDCPIRVKQGNNICLHVL